MILTKLGFKMTGAWPPILEQTNCSVTSVLWAAPLNQLSDSEISPSFLMAAHHSDHFPKSLNWKNMLQCDVHTPSACPGLWTWWKYKVSPGWGFPSFGKWNCLIETYYVGGFVIGDYQHVKARQWRKGLPPFSLHCLEREIHLSNGLKKIDLICFPNFFLWMVFILLCKKLLIKIRFRFMSIFYCFKRGRHPLWKKNILLEWMELYLSWTDISEIRLHNVKSRVITRKTMFLHQHPLL